MVKVIPHHPLTPAGCSLEAYLPQLMTRLEHQRKGLVPFIIVAALVVLILVVAIIRAAASAHSQHSGGICFLAKLGIRIGKGCGAPQVRGASTIKGCAFHVRQGDMSLPSVTLWPCLSRYARRLEALRRRVAFPKMHGPLTSLRFCTMHLLLACTASHICCPVAGMGSCGKGFSVIKSHVATGCMYKR